MAASHLTHDIVCIGSHEPHQHDFHAANARAVHALFTGGLGPERAVVECLASPHVHTAHVEGALEAAVDRGATNLVVYFSGRGSARGLHVSNGTIDAETLGRHLAQSRARAVLLLLDLAIGADPDQALLPNWLRTLAANHPTLRAAAARATRIGAGAEGEGLARFTAALLSTLESAPGDIRLDRVKYISDKLALEQTSHILAERWATTNLPLAVGNFGDMPLAKSQANSTLGHASISSITAGSGLSASVAWVIEGRANMTTRVHYALVRPDGTIVSEASTEVVPKNPFQKGKTRVRFQKASLGRPRAAISTLSGFRWVVALRDSRGRTLAEHTLDLP